MKFDVITFRFAHLDFDFKEEVPAFEMISYSRLSFQYSRPSSNENLERKYFWYC